MKKIVLLAVLTIFGVATSNAQAKKAEKKEVAKKEVAPSKADSQKVDGAGMIF
jgi:hypothetical protein